MAIDYSTAALITTVKRIASVPTSQKLLKNDAFIGILNDELQATLVPEIMSVREEYFVAYIDHVIASHSVDFLVDIPSNAIGGKLREVAWVDNNGCLNKLPRIDLEADNNQRNGGVSGFRIQDNSIVLSPSSGGTLRVFYFKRPNELIETSQAAKIIAINGNEIQVNSSIPTSWIVGEKLNTISVVQPFQNKATNLTIVNVSFPIVEVDSVVGVSVGDWICMEGYSPIPQVPVEAHRVLAQLAAAKCLEALGDDKVVVAQKQAIKLMENLFKVINPRIDASPKRIVGAGISSYIRR